MSTDIDTLWSRGFFYVYTGVSPKAQKIRIPIKHWTKQSTNHSLTQSINHSINPSVELGTFTIMKPNPDIYYGRKSLHIDLHKIVVQLTTLNMRFGVTHIVHCRPRLSVLQSLGGNQRRHHMTLGTTYCKRSRLCHISFNATLK